jgi:TonB-dependent SusC/RagA subfamily outer membrane receptor
MLSTIPISDDLNAATAMQQQVDITGRVTDAATGEPLAGVSVRVSDTDIRTVTDAEGYYSISAPAQAVGGVARAPQGVLVFTRIGYRAVAAEMAGRITVDVSMEQSIAVLDEVVVTGYMAQRRADITGAVGSVDVESVNRQSSASVLKALDGRVAGVTVETSGSPGSRSTIRVRGISSFQNNDPLYIIDGTPTVGSYLNFLNPNDIESIQVLKDASAASIYGARAQNGVIIIETKKGSVGAGCTSRCGQPHPWV